MYFYCLHYICSFICFFLSLCAGMFQCVFQYLSHLLYCFFHSVSYSLFLLFVFLWKTVYVRLQLCVMICFVSFCLLAFYKKTYFVCFHVVFQTNLVEDSSFRCLGTLMVCFLTVICATTQLNWFSTTINLGFDGCSINKLLFVKHRCLLKIVFW